MGDEFVDHQLAAQVVVHQVWELAAALDAAECAALPHTSGDQLECYSRQYIILFFSFFFFFSHQKERLTSSGNLLASSSNTDNDTLTPPLVAGLQGGTHHAHVASAVESVVTATVSHVD